MTSDGTRPRHRSGHRCRGARAGPRRPGRRRRRRGPAALPRGRLGGPASGGVDPRRGAAEPARRPAADGRRTRCTAGRGVLRGRVRGRGRAAHRDRQGLPRRGPRAAPPAPAHLGPGPVRGPAGVAGPPDRPPHHRTLARRRRGSWTTRSPRSRTGSGPPAWTGWSRRRSSGSCRPRPAAAGRPPPMPGTRTCTPDQVSFEGTVWVEAEVDLADALDLDTALSAGAARLADLGSTASLDVRRSEALGQMARHQLALDLDTDAQPGPPGRRGRPARAPLRTGDRGTERGAAPGPGGEHPLASSTPSRSAPGAATPGTR